MEQGVHLFLERPLGTKVDDARRAVKCARAHIRKLAVRDVLRRPVDVLAERGWGSARHVQPCRKARAKP